MAKHGLAAIWLLTAWLPTASYGQANSENIWHLLERVNPAPATRSDWIAVGPSAAQVDGWVIVGRAPSASSWARAVADADAYRLNDARFRAVCDRQRYRVVRNSQTNNLGVTAGEVPYGYFLERAGLCCEEAYEVAFPGAPGPDCRTLGLQSLPGSSVRLTPAGWGALGGAPVVLATVPPTVIPAASLSLSGAAGGGNCQTVQTMNQPESRDAAGRITVEAATIHVMNCPDGGQVYIYQYSNRPGFRAIRPPDWGRSIGGRDFSTFEQAQAAAIGGDVAPPQPQRVCPDGSIALLGVCSERPARPIGATGMPNDPLGAAWDEQESGQTAVWTRRPGGNTFDARWSSGTRAVLEMKLAGTSVTIERRQGSDGNDCHYTGTMTGAEIRGTYTCTKYTPSPIPWRATVRSPR